VMENVIEEPVAVTDLQSAIFFVLLLSVSIMLLRILGRSIDKSVPPANQSPDDSSPWDLSSVFLLFSFFLLGQLAIYTFAMLPSPESQDATATEVHQPILFIGLSLVNLVISTIAFYLHRARKVLQQNDVSFWLGTRGDARGALKLGVLTLLCWIPGHIGIAGLWSLFLENREVEIHSQESVQLLAQALQQHDWALIIPFFLYGIVMAPVAEEILFRGVLFRWLRGHWGLYAALAVSSIAFALVHDSIASWLPIAALGGVCAWLYHRSGQLLASITTHAVFNASTMLLITFFQEEI